jgi:hypothetical protein
MASRRRKSDCWPTIGRRMARPSSFQTASRNVA